MMMSHVSYEKQPLDALVFFSKWYLILKCLSNKRKILNKLPAGVVFLPMMPSLHYKKKKKENYKQKNIAAKF